MLGGGVRPGQTGNRLLLGLMLGAALGRAFAQGDAKRGEYLAKAGGCVGCHTEEKKDAVPFAGGRALTSPFGTVYGPNITPPPQAGNGGRAEAPFFPRMAQSDRAHRQKLFPALPLPPVQQVRT